MCARAREFPRVSAISGNGSPNSDCSTLGIAMNKFRPESRTHARTHPRSLVIAESFPVSLEIPSDSRGPPVAARDRLGSPLVSFSCLSGLKRTGGERGGSEIDTGRSRVYVTYTHIYRIYTIEGESKRERDM